MAKTSTSKSNPEQSEPKRQSWLRSSLIAILIALGCLSFGVYVAVHWVERQILTTDNWVALVTPLPKQPVVSNALGSYIGKKVFAAAPVEQTISDALPPKAAFLAGPLANQLSSITTKTAQRLVASDAFQTIWVGANRAAINRVLTVGRSQTSPLQSKVNEKFNINLSDVSTQLRGALGKASTAIPSLQPESKQKIQVAADLKAGRQRLRQVIQTTDFINAILPLMIVASLLGALAISKHRRKTTMTITVVIAVLMLVELIAIKGARQGVLNQVQDSSNLAAIGYIYDVIVSLLKHMIYVALGAAFVAYLICLVSGPARWAVNLRSYVRLERLANSRAMQWWHKARAWTGQQRYKLWGGSALIILAIIALFIDVDWQAIINGLLLILSSFAAIYIVGTPKPLTTAKQIKK